MKNLTKTRTRSKFQELLKNDYTRYNKEILEELQEEGMITTLKVHQDFINELRTYCSCKCPDYNTGKFYLNDKEYAHHQDLMVELVNYLNEDNPDNYYKPVHYKFLALHTNEPSFDIELMLKYKMIENYKYGSYQAGRISKRYRFTQEYLWRLKHNDPDLIPLELHKDSIFLDIDKLNNHNQKRLKLINGYDYSINETMIERRTKVLNKSLITCAEKGIQNVNFIVNQQINNFKKYFEKINDVFCSSVMGVINTGKIFVKYFQNKFQYYGQTLFTIMDIIKVDFSKLVLIRDIYDIRLKNAKGKYIEDDDLTDLYNELAAMGI